MSGRVIQALRVCSQTRWLNDSERHALASCGRSSVCLPGETILQPHDTALCILLQGRVTLQLVMPAQGGDCGGEATIELSSPDAAFGWGMWVRPERIAVTARVVTRSQVVIFELSCPPCGAGFAALGRRMTLYLYGLLLEGGICPPSMQSFLQLSQSISFDGGES